MLDDLRLPDLAGLKCQYLGLDSPTHARDPRWFHDPMWNIDYQFNSRGFRDAEWPMTPIGLKTSIWCIGCSYTLGMGVAQQHSWPARLQERTKMRTINLGCNGASNQWIARRAVEVIDQVEPLVMICHWSFSHRREMSAEQAWQQRWQTFYQAVRDPSWPQCDHPGQLLDHHRQELEQNPAWSGILGPVWDDQRQLHYSQDPVTDSEDDFLLTNECIEYVENNRRDTLVIHSTIPKWHHQDIEPAWPKGALTLPPMSRLDRARDQVHYGFLTNDGLAAQIYRFLVNTCL